MEYFNQSIDRILPSCFFCLEEKTKDLLFNKKELSLLRYLNCYYLPNNIHIVPLADGLKKDFFDYVDNKYKFLLVDSLRKNIFCITSDMKDYLNLFLDYRSKADVKALNRTEKYCDFFKNLIGVEFIKFNEGNFTTKKISIREIPQKYGFSEADLISQNENCYSFVVCKEGSKQMFLKQMRINDAEYKVDFAHLIFTMKKLQNSPYFLKLLDYNIESLYYVTEYRNGVTLEELLKKGITLSEKINIIKKIVSALSFIHSRNIVHGDLHLGQFLVVNNSKLKLIDYEMMTDISTQHNTLYMGATFEYIEPESLCIDPFILICKGDMKLKAEIYRLGVLIYSILYEIPPFYELTWKQLYRSKLEDDITFAEKDKFDELIPLPLIEVMKVCLNRNPDLRFSSAKDIESILDL